MLSNRPMDKGSQRNSLISGCTSYYFILAIPLLKSDSRRNYLRIYRSDISPNSRLRGCAAAVLYIDLTPPRFPRPGFAAQ